MVPLLPLVIIIPDVFFSKLASSWLVSGGGNDLNAKLGEELEDNPSLVEEVTTVLNGS